MSAAAFVTLQSGLGDGHCIDNHVAELTNEHGFLICPVAMVRNTDVVPTLEEGMEFFHALFEAVVIAFDGHILVHDVTEFMVHLMCIFRAVHVTNLVEFFYALFAGCFEFFLRERITQFAAAGKTQCFRAGDGAGVSGRQQGVCTQTVCTMILIVAFAGSHKARDVRVMFTVYPDAAHGVMDGREDFHRHFTRILTYEVIVHFEDAAQFAFEVISRNMGQVEVYAVRVGHAEAHVHNNLVDCAGCNVTRYEVAVCRIHIFEEVPAFFFARLGVLAIYPDTAAFTTAGFGHQAVLIGTRNSRRMNLQEFGVTDFCALLVNSGYGRTIADGGSRAAAIYLTGAAGSKDYHISGESHDFVGVHVLRNDTTANAVFILDDFDEFPEFIFLDAALNFPAANLLVESIEELLTRGGAGKYGTLVLLAAEVTEVKHTFRRTRERHAHAVKHLDQLRSCFNHALNSQLVS